MRPQRGCRQPHGTIAHYAAGCSCLDCCDAKNEYQQAWKAEGGGRRVDAAPMREHLRTLLYNGWRTRGIAEQSGVPYGTVRRYREGRYDDGTPVRFVLRDNADAILALPLQTPIPTDSTALVPARSTLNLISRLTRDYSLEQIASVCGVSRRALPQKGQHSVQARTAKRVREAARKLREAVA